MSDEYFTSGYAAKYLRVSISTLKRWINDERALMSRHYRNASGWRLFSSKDLEMLKQFKRGKKRNGKKFKPHTLEPVAG